MKKKNQESLFPPDLITGTFAVISTAHISEQDNAYLTENLSHIDLTTFFLDPVPGGFLFTPLDSSGDLIKEHCIRNGLDPETFIKLNAFCRKYDIGKLFITVDGNVIEELSKFEWENGEQQ